MTFLSTSIKLYIYTKPKHVAHSAYCLVSQIYISRQLFITHNKSKLSSVQWQSRALGDYVTYGGNLTKIFCMRRFGLSYTAGATRLARPGQYSMDHQKCQICHKIGKMGQHRLSMALSWNSVIAVMSQDGRCR